MEPSKVFPIYQLQDAFEAFCNGEPAAKPQHRSLYYFLLGYCRRRGNTPRFSLTHEAGMHGSAIGSWATYDTAMKALAEWGFIVYTPGANRYKVPVIELTFRNPTDDVLMSYWQSYCLSTSNPSDNPSGDQLVTLKEELKRAKEEIEKLRKNGRMEGSQPASQPSSFSSSESEGLVVEKGPPKGLPDQAEVFKTAGFATFVTKMGFGHIDRGVYLPEIQRKAEMMKQERDEAGWENFVLEYLKKEKASGKLVTRELTKADERNHFTVPPPPSQQTTPAAIARQAELDAQATARTKAHFAHWAKRVANNAANAANATEQ